MEMKGTKATILVVDDNAMARAFIVDLLAAPQRAFVEAADGSEAIALYESVRPDLVLMDIEMQPMDGITATQAIHERDSKGVVVIVSDHDGPRFRAAAEKAGASAFVNKSELAGLDDVVEPYLLG